MRAIIPVAGFGTRLKPHTLTHPKVLLNVGGKPIISHIVEKLLEENINEATFIVGYLGEKIHDYISTTFPELKADYVEQKELLGLGHAIYQAARTFGDEEIVIILGDTVFDVDLGQITKLSNSALGVKVVDDPRRFGVVELENGFIKKLIVNDFTINLKLRFIGGLPHMGFGANIILRSNLNETGKESNAYHVGLGTGNIGGVFVVKKKTIKGKTWYTTLFHDKYPTVKFAKWYELKVRMQAAKITVWVDGKQVAELEDKDNPFLSGTVGIGTYGAAIEVDNVTIEDGVS